MESSSNSTSLFLSTSNNNIDELLSCDHPSSPQSSLYLSPLIQEMHHSFNATNTNHAYTPWPSPPLASHLSPNPLSSQSLFQGPPPPLHSPQFSAANHRSYHPTLYQFSPRVSSNHDLIRSPAVGFAKRDWLSSLSQSSASIGPSAPVPTCTPPSSSSSSFAHQHSLIASSDSQLACENHALRPSSSTNNLQNCKTLPSSWQLRDTSSYIDLGLSHRANRMQFMQSNEPGLRDWNKIHNHDDELRGNSMGGVTGLRLSNLISAMQSKPFANASQNSPNKFALNPSNSPSNSVNLTINGVDRPINPALINPCEVNTSSKILANVDELLHRSCTNGQLARSKPASRRGESKKSKKTDKSESVSSKEINKVAVLNGVVQNTIKARDFGSMGDPGSKRVVHIYSERERRRDMTHLYATLCSLLPKGKIKADRCSVLTETMEYIQSLLEKLDELGKQKVEVLSSMKAAVETRTTKPAASTASEKPTKKNSLPSTGIDLSVDDDTNVAKSSKIVMNRNSAEICSAKPSKNGASSCTLAAGRGVETGLTNYAEAKANARTSKDLEGQGKAKMSENRMKMSMNNYKNAESQREALSNRALGGGNGSSEENSSDENDRVDMCKDGDDGEKLNDGVDDECDSEKIDDVLLGCDQVNGDESVIGSKGAKGEVKVRFFGEDAFITVRTLKARGTWSGLLEVLQHFGIHILNVTLSASSDSDHHCIHAKLPSGCKLSSFALKQSLKAFVGEAQKACPRTVGRESPTLSSH